MAFPSPEASTARPGDWLRLEAAAKRLATSKRTLYRLGPETRRIPFRRLPGTSIVAFAPEDIEAIERAALVPPLTGRAA